MSIFDTFTRSGLPYTGTESFVNSFANLATYNVVAYNDGSTNYNLTMGASSNVVIEAVQELNVFTGSGKTSFYSTTTTSNASRVDKLIFDIYNSNSTTVLSSDTNALKLDFTGQLNFSSFYINTSDAYVDAIGSEKRDGFTFDSEVTFQKPSIFNSSIFIQGNLFASNINLFHSKNTIGSNSVKEVGYGFRMNDIDQLELVKVASFNDNTTVTKRLAIFGYNDIEYTASNETSYLAFDELNGMGLVSSNQVPTFKSLAIYGGKMLGDIDMNTHSLSNVGTITASNMTVQSYIISPGADYAEYMFKTVPTETFVPGQVVGVDQCGKITSSFSESIHFLIVSENPSIIGGNTWKGSIPTIDQVEEFNKYSEMDASRVIVAYCGRVKLSKYAQMGSFIVPCSGSNDEICTTSKLTNDM
jgi:hypothetical protein